jgi:hypothetical protein
MFPEYDAVKITTSEESPMLGSSDDRSLRWWARLEVAVPWLFVAAEFLAAAALIGHHDPVVRAQSSDDRAKRQTAKSSDDQIAPVPLRKEMLQGRMAVDTAGRASVPARRRELPESTKPTRLHEFLETQSAGPR